MPFQDPLYKDSETPPASNCSILDRSHFTMSHMGSVRVFGAGPNLVGAIPEEEEVGGGGGGVEGTDGTL